MPFLEWLVEGLRAESLARLRRAWNERNDIIAHGSPFMKLHDSSNN
jgi:hypothetical protein